MVRHEFGFGTAIAANEFNTNDSYRNTLFEMFNEVVFENDLKWPQFNAEASNDHLIQAMDYSGCTPDSHQGTQCDLALLQVLSAFPGRFG